MLVHQPPEHAAASAAAGSSAIAAASSAASLSLRFQSGKSALFQLGESGLTNLLSVSPLQVLLLDLQLIRAPKLVASTSVDLSALRRDMLVPLVSSKAAGFHRGLFPMRDLMGNEVGHIALVLRLACMGSAMLPHLRAIPQLSREKQNWIERSVQSAKENASASGSGVSSHSLSAIPPQIAQLDPVPRDDTATSYRAKEATRAARRAQFEAEEAARERLEAGDNLDAAPSQQQQQQSTQPAILSRSAVDPSAPSSHRAQLILGPSVSVTQKPLSAVSRYHTLETLNAAISKELAHHNLAPVGSGGAAARADAPWIADLTSLAKNLVPQADDYSPPALFFFRDSAQAEQQNHGLLEVEYRRAVEAEQSREEQAARERKQMYEPQHAQRFNHLQQQQQHQPRQQQQEQQQQPHWPTDAESDQHPSQLTFHSEPVSNHAPSTAARHPSLQYSNGSSATAAAQSSTATSAPGSPSASRRSALRSAPPAAAAAASPSRSPLTPHRQQLRHHPSQHQQQFDPARLSRSRSSSPNRVSNLERKYREMEAQIALENKQRAREAAWNGDVIRSAPIPRGRPLRVAPEDRQRPVRAAKPKAKGFDSGLTPPKPELTPRIDDDTIDAAALRHPKPASLPTEYGAFKPVPKLKHLPLAALDQPGVPRRMNRATTAVAVRRPQSASVSGGTRGPLKPRPASASSSRQHQPVPTHTASTTPYARAFEEVEQMHDQLDSQRDMLDDDAGRNRRSTASLPASPMRRLHPSVQHAIASPPLSPARAHGGGPQQGSKHVQFQRTTPRVDSNVQPRIPTPPSPTASELAAGSVGRAGHQFSSWNDASSSSGAPQKQELDSLFSQVESKLAARTELLYRARAEHAAPAEYIAPLSPWTQSVESLRATRAAMVDAALEDVRSRPPISESSLASVALDYLNHTQPRSKAEMSEFLLRQQLAEIRALTSQPAAAIDQQLYDLSRAHVQRHQQQQHHALQPHPQQLEQATQGQYQWEENLSLAS